ncbi:MAG: signal peptidase I [Helicobacter sp.]|nr:signal peptidase I [Helicobacter sp.]
MKQTLIKIKNFANSWIGTIIIVLSLIFFVAQAFVIPSGSMLNTMLIGDNLFVKKYSYGIPTPTIPWIELPIIPDFKNNGHLIQGPRPKRGDIVVFRYPLSPKTHYVKRNIAINGDEVLYTKEGLWISFKEENLYSNNPEKTLTYRGKTYIYEPYIKKHPGIHYTKTGANAFTQLYGLFQNGQDIAMEPVRLENGELAFYTQVGEDEFFMMGDNRDNSFDSRFWGSVNYRYIIGKPWFIYLSWDDNFNIRWQRIGKSIETLELEELEAIQAKPKA